jgi:RNA polymerase sigma factor (sigma-70 family)
MQDEQSRKQDDELIARTQAGDAAAFDELIVKYSPRLYGLVYNMTSNHEDTNDLMQDIWAKAFRSINGFRGKSSFYTWIHSIGVNMTINFLKKRNRRYHLSLETWTPACRRQGVHRSPPVDAGPRGGPRGTAKRGTRPCRNCPTIIAPWSLCSISGHAARRDCEDPRHPEGTVRSRPFASPFAKFHRVPLSQSPHDRRTALAPLRLKALQPPRLFDRLRRTCIGGSVELLQRPLRQIAVEHPRFLQRAQHKQLTHAGSMAAVLVVVSARSG